MPLPVRRQEIYSGGDGIAMPQDDDDDDALVNVSPYRSGLSALASAWWVLASMALVSALLGGAYRWVILIAGAECYSCVRRSFTSYKIQRGHVKRTEDAVTMRACTHFEYFRLSDTAPTDALIAQLLALENLECVREVHIGQDAESAQKNSHGFLATFGSSSARDAFLLHPDRLSFVDNLAPHIKLHIIFAFPEM